MLAPAVYPACSCGRSLYSVSERTNGRCRVCLEASMPKPKPIKDWSCQECGKAYNLRGAERATANGCVKCGGYDIDLRDLPASKVSR